MVKLTREQALALGGREITIDENNSITLPIGHRGACAVNSLNIVKNGKGDFYCLGYAAGSRNEYEPHAWIKIGEQYLECSPQEGCGHKYILVKELTLSQVMAVVKSHGFTGEFIPPLLDETGNFFFLMPEDHE